MAILNNSNAISVAGAYDVNNSLRIRASASAFLNRTPGTTGNQKTFTWSGWVKRGALGSQQFIHHAFYGDSGRYSSIFFTSSDTLRVQSGIYTTGASTTTSYDYITTQVFRDPSAWYHIVLAVDTTQATSGNRVKVYVNGSQITAFGTSTAPSQNDNTFFNITTTPMYIGKYAEAPGSSFLDGYLAEVNWIDGSQKAASDFGETDTTTGVWKPKAYTSTYGTNGFYLKFSDIATTSGSNAGLGKDFSGNANYLTTNNISVTAGTTYDAMTDSPTLTSATVANYAVLNPLPGPQAANIGLLSNANLSIANNAGATNMFGFNTIGIDSGAYYWEVTVTGIPTSNSSTMAIGVCGQPYTDAAMRGYYNNGNYWNGSASISYGATYTTNDIIGVAFDATNQTIEFFKNGTSQGQKTSIGTSGTTEFAWILSSSTPGAASFNFGQRPFSYTPPTGFVRLNTYNLPDSTIKKGNTVMDATLYTGTGSSQSISGLNFQPDLVWVKGRSGATDNALYDAVCGVQLQLESNTTTDQTTETTGLTAFNSNGFTVGALAQLNTSSATYVGWSWKETATSGFDIVTYTGNGSNRTISHSLGVAPKMIIVKARTTASTDQGWAVYHSANTAAPETDYLLLNSTAATADLDTVWNDTAPTSSVFSVGTNALVNTNNDTYVAYCWAAIPGFSAFGSYTGNNSSDGNFIYLGFRPRWIMCKQTSGAGGAWFILDTARNTFNVMNNILDANSSGAERNDNIWDATANGMKLRIALSGDFIYAAFAENPTKYALAR